MASFPPKRKHIFHAELAKLVEAGFGIREAARVLLDGDPPAPERKLLEGLLAGLSEGRSIAVSFEGGGLSRLELGIIAAGEKGGKLGEAFLHLADYFEMVAKARRNAVSAMVYPLVLLHLGILLAVVPSDVVSGGLAAGQVLTRLVTALFVCYGVIALGMMLALRLLKSAESNASVDRFIRRIPLVGKVRAKLAMGRFVKVYHAGLVAGLSMNETASMSGEAAASGSIRDASKRLVAAAKEGETLGPVFVAEKAFPRAFARSYATAEESGTLDKDLVRWGKVYADEAAAGVRRLSVVLPKLGYALVVVFVVWKLLGFYSGYYGSLEKL